VGDHNKDRRYTGRANGHSRTKIDPREKLFPLENLFSESIAIEVGDEEQARDLHLSVR
jgi:hypothetical protein